MIRLFNQATNYCFSYVFWFGDLNFRLEGNSQPAELSAAVAEGRLSELWEQDELSRVRSTGEAFSELHEERPTFAPTYKHELGKTKYSNK